MKSIKLTIIFVILLAFTLSVSAQSVNKLPEFLSIYEYLLVNKIKGLEFSVSTDEDVARFFGKNCTKKCDYDENWEIAFGYFNEKWTKKYIYSKGREEIYKPKAEFYGRLSSLILFPKSKIIIPEDILSIRDRNFKCSKENLNRKIKGEKINYNSITCFNYKDIDVSISDETDKSKDILKGQLMYIYYRPKDKDKDVFYLVKN